MSFFPTVLGLYLGRSLLVLTWSWICRTNRLLNFLCFTDFVTNFFTILSLTVCKFLNFDFSKISSKFVYSDPQIMCNPVCNTLDKSECVARGTFGMV